jgi:hypothetical protein
MKRRNAFTMILIWKLKGLSLPFSSFVLWCWHYSCQCLNLLFIEARGSRVGNRLHLYGCDEDSRHTMEVTPLLPRIELLLWHSKSWCEVLTWLRLPSRRSNGKRLKLCALCIDLKVRVIGKTLCSSQPRPWTLHILWVSSSKAHDIVLFYFMVRGVIGSGSLVLRYNYPSSSLLHQVKIESLVSAHPLASSFCVQLYFILRLYSSSEKDWGFGELICLPEEVDSSRCWLLLQRL